ncbi:MAG TPA: hypothetical protein PLN14_00050 [Candidatus Hydrothermia bacterium]|nr:hypothetical protein [Candidatus Hydrothermia bacterium]HPO78128.1 hypothetical protein [Candidatus Hydrothermia bacterium]
MQDFAPLCSSLNNLDFLDTCIDFHLTGKPFYLVYIESLDFAPLQLKDTPNSPLDSLTDIDKARTFYFQNSALISLSFDPYAFIKTITERIGELSHKNVKFNSAVVQIKKIMRHPSTHLHNVYSKVKNKKRYLHIPNIEGYLKLLELLDRGVKEALVDTPESWFNQIADLLTIISAMPCTVERKSEDYFLKVNKDNKWQALKLLQFKGLNLDDSSDEVIKIDSVSIEETQKILQSYFVYPNIGRDLLEIIYYRSMGRYRTILSLVDSMISQKHILWNPDLGWIIEVPGTDSHTKIFPFTESNLFDSLNKTERTLLYAIISSAHPIEKKELVKMIPGVKIQEFEAALEKLVQMGTIRVRGGKLSSSLPALDFIPEAHLSPAECRRIHGYLADSLCKKKMNGSLVPSWQIARHFELAGNYRSTLRYYLEASDEDLKNNKIEEAIKHLKRALIITKSPRIRTELRLMIANLYTKNGNYHRALKFMEEAIKSSKAPTKLKRSISIKQIQLLNQIGEVKSACKILKELESSSSRCPTELFFEQYKLALKKDQLDPYLVKKLKKVARNLSPTSYNRSLPYELVGDTEYYYNHPERAIENYTKSLKIHPEESLSLLTELKLAETLLLELKAREAFFHIEHVLWLSTSINDEYAKNHILEQIGKIYLYILPPENVARFLRYSIEDMLSGPPIQNYAYFYLMGLYSLKVGKFEKGKKLMEMEIARTRTQHNYLRSNIISLELASYLIRFEELQSAQALLKSVRTRSTFLLNLKELLETIITLKSSIQKSVDFKNIEVISNQNALNMLIFLEITENLHVAEIVDLREKVKEKLEALHSVLKEFDLGNHP